MKLSELIYAIMLLAGLIDIITYLIKLINQNKLR